MEDRHEHDSFGDGAADMTRSVGSLRGGRNGAAADGGEISGSHGRWSSEFTRKSGDWDGDGGRGELDLEAGGGGAEAEGKKRVVVVERLKKIPGKAFFSGW